jgi:hypothetical protein
LFHPARSSREEAAIATTEYILTDADVGRAFPEVDDLLSLVRSRSPNHRGSTSPNWSETHFVLRDSQSTQNLFCLDHLCVAPLMIGGACYFLNNAAIRFHGETQARRGAAHRYGGLTRVA